MIRAALLAGAGAVLAPTAAGRAGSRPLGPAGPDESDDRPAAARVAAVPPAPRPGGRERDDHLALYVEADGIGGPGGGGIGGEWYRTSPSRHLVRTGAYGFSLSGIRWGYARLGGALPWGEAVTLEGLADLGRGSDHGRGFGYQSYDLNLTVRLLPGRLYAEAGDRYLDVDRQHGHLLQAGGVVIPATPLALRVRYFHAAGGNLATRQVLVRADLARGPFGLLAGFSLGHQDIALAGTPGLLHSQGVFAGATLPLGSTSLVWAFASDEVEGERRGRLLATLKRRL